VRMAPISSSNRRPKIAVLTALPPELTAVKHLFHFMSDRMEEEGDYLFSRLEGKGGSHEVLLADLAKGQIDTASKITEIDKDFPSIQAYISVGVCGSPFDLGDVVIPSKVVYIGPAKINPGETVPRGETPVPSPELVEQAGFFEKRASDLDADRSWRSQYRDFMNSATVRESLAPFWAKSGQDPEKVPNIHVDAIGTSDQVINDKSTRDSLMESHHVAAFETESAGLAKISTKYHKEYLAIRGVSDHAYNKTPESDDLWQPYSAHVAAAFLACLLKRRPPFGPPGRTKIELDDDTIVSMRNVVGSRRPTLSADIESMIREMTNKYPEAVAVMQYDDQSGEAFANMLLDGLRRHKSILTMWTIGLGDKLLGSYITRVLPEELKAIKAGVQIKRIVAHLSVLDTLRYIALHAQTFRESRAVTYQLYLPRVKVKPSSLDEILLSSDLCPKVEIVVIGRERASIDSEGQQEAARIHSETSDQNLVESIYQQLFRWFIRGPSHQAIDNRDGLERWTMDLEKAIAAVEQRGRIISVSPKENVKDSINAARNLIGAIRRAAGADFSLDEKWWNETSPLYTRHFTSVENPFLRAFFFEEVAALRKVLDSARNSNGEPPVYVEIGCGAGRTFKELLDTRGGIGSVAPAAALLGVDFSSGMIRQCHQSMSSFTKGPFAWPIPWGLICGDGCNLHTIIDGTGRNRGLSSATSVIGNLDGMNDLLRNRTWVVGLTSVLPNLSHSDCVKMVQAVKQAVSPSDIVFASSYNAAHFSRVAYELYKNDEVADISGSTVVVYDPVRCVYSSVDEKSGRFFTSKWFNVEGLLDVFGKGRMYSVSPLQVQKPEQVQRFEQQQEFSPEPISGLTRILKDTPFPRGVFVDGRVGQ